MLYDPSVVTDAVFEQLHGLQAVAPVALGWTTGNGNTTLPLVAQPEHWRAHDRAETTAQVARIVQLGWECSLAMLPLHVASNEADIRLRFPRLDDHKKKAHLAHYRERNRGPVNEPRQAWIVTRESRLAVTWDFMLGFTTAQKRELFGPWHQVEFAWPAEAYQVNGWTFPTIESDKTGWISQYVLQLEAWAAGEPG
ncbi:hypothetical protein Sinac_0298 [Singulisphaera acidiphila DSM 18658]|uniref:Uncharacterized protein n=2 Tax=Singulisphaera acidiphila TaxID=466153 RepID=L0D5P7_SINAD|nr:hypothetical protein Sinac_0298 [Singulisphaera acidiphila DSM 18658]